MLVTIKFLRFLILLPPLVSCVHPNPCASTHPPAVVETPVPVAVAIEAPGELVFEQKFNQMLRPDGPVVFLNNDIDAAFGVDHATALIEMLKNALRAKKFDVRTVSVGAMNEMTVTSFDDPGRGLSGVHISWGVRRAHRRPLEWFRQTYAVRSPLPAAREKFDAKIRENFEALEIQPPSVAVRAFTGPTCAPRFGLTSNARAVITAVVANGPADRAGVKVGDLLEAVDSAAPRFDRPLVSADVYANRTVVPVRLKRGDVIVRTAVRAENVCE